MYAKKIHLRYGFLAPRILSYFVRIQCLGACSHFTGIFLRRAKADNPIYYLKKNRTKNVSHRLRCSFHHKIRIWFVYKLRFVDISAAAIAYPFDFDKDDLIRSEEIHVEDCAGIFYFIQYAMEFSRIVSIWAKYISVDPENYIAIFTFFETHLFAWRRFEN